MSGSGASETSDIPLVGAVPAGGLAATIRIPVPGSGNLAIELSPRGFKGKSTSTLFIQDITGKKTLRLDYGFNKRTNTVDYHWNQKGTYEVFHIEDHTALGPEGEALYGAARTFKYVGRSLVVVGAAMDLISIARASNPLRRSTAVVTAWAMAWAGAESLGAAGAAGGTFVGGPVGTAVGGLVFGFIGGVGGYMAGEKLGDMVYDWADGTKFTPLPEVGPSSAGPEWQGLRTAPFEQGGPGLPVFVRPVRPLSK